MRMTHQTTIRTNDVLYAGFIQDANPRVLESILTRLKDGYVVGEFLNRVAGGVHCEQIPENKIAIELAKDPSHTLKATYSRADLERRISKLQNSDK